MPDFIDAEIARHCPSPSPRSKALIAVMPLVLWQIVLLVEEDAQDGDGAIRSTCQLVDAARKNLNTNGIHVAEGDLVRKVCVPLIARYVAHHVGRRLPVADEQRCAIRERAERVLRERLLRLITSCLSYHTDDIHRWLSDKGDLSKILRSEDAEDIMAGRIPCAADTPKVIQLGRGLFA